LNGPSTRKSPLQCRKAQANGCVYSPWACLNSATAEIANYREYLDFGQVLLQLGVSPEGLHRALSKKLARALTTADGGAA